MSKIIKGPWKPREYDPNKDPEFDLDSDIPIMAIVLTVGFIILAIIVLYKL